MTDKEYPKGRSGIKKPERFSSDRTYCGFFKKEGTGTTLKKPVGFQGRGRYIDPKNLFCSVGQGFSGKNPGGESISDSYEEYDADYRK